MYMRPFEKLKARILKSIITWSGMAQQTDQAKKGLYRVLIGVYSGCILFYMMELFTFQDDCPILLSENTSFLLYSIQYTS